jgi:hypothetical protein
MTARARKAVAPKRDRSGHYNTPRGKFMSVTTILSNGIPKPNLVHWAACEVARSAVDNLPKLVRVRGQQQREEAFDWLRRAAETKRDTAANLGSAVHSAVEAIILGEPKPEPSDEQKPFLAAFDRFVADWAPQWESTELVVANPDHGWAGTLDWLATLDGLGPVLVLGDWKTGKGVYAEAALQLAAYRRATVGWMSNGTEVEMPYAERAVVVHLRPDNYPDTGYRVIPVDTSDRVYAAFRSAQQVAEYAKTLADQLVGEPLEAKALEVA